VEETINGESQEAPSEGNGAEDLEAKLAAANAELEKLRAIKDKMAKEQVEKNRIKNTLKEERQMLQQQLDELKSQFQGSMGELVALKEYRERVLSEQKAELESLVSGIPENKRSLFEDIPEEKRLSYIKKNWSHFFETSAPQPRMSDALFFPMREQQSVSVMLSPAEKALIAGKLTEDAAIELKQADPNYFQKYLKK